MKKPIIPFAICMVVFCNIAFCSMAQPDTVKTGIYVTSIHNIDFKLNEYTVDFWAWFTYKNKAFDFIHNLEIPQAKTVVKSFTTLDSSGDKIYLLLKIQCVMQDSWKIANFPFDRQVLRLSFENAQYDSRSLIFLPDTKGEHFDPRFTMRGWNIDSFVISTPVRKYETNFGDESQPKPQTEYSSLRVRICLGRDANELFWKMFLGMYVSFLIAYTCFYIHADNIDSRFALSVGALFAAIGNKYVIDSALPETTSFTLVDTLHGFTLFFIFLVITACVYSLNLVKQNKTQKGRWFNMVAAQTLLVAYVIVNFYFIKLAKG